MKIRVNSNQTTKMVMWDQQTKRIVNRNVFSQLFHRIVSIWNPSRYKRLVHNAAKKAILSQLQHEIFGEGSNLGQLETKRFSDTITEHLSRRDIINAQVATEVSKSIRQLEGQPSEPLTAETPIIQPAAEEFQQPVVSTPIIQPTADEFKQPTNKPSLAAQKAGTHAEPSHPDTQKLAQKNQPTAAEFKPPTNKSSLAVQAARTHTEPSHPDTQKLAQKKLQQKMLIAKVDRLRKDMDYPGIQQRQKINETIAKDNELRELWLDEADYLHGELATLNPRTQKKQIRYYQKEIDKINRLVERINAGIRHKLAEIDKLYAKTKAKTWARDITKQEITAKHQPGIAAAEEQLTAVDELIKKELARIEKNYPVVSHPEGKLGDLPSLKSKIESDLELLKKNLAEELEAA